MAEKAGKRRRPSAKETRARMARAVGAESPMSRAEPEPEPEEARGSLEEDFPERQLVVPEGKNAERSAKPVAEGRLVRLSVDVSAGEHRALRIMAAETGSTGMGVMRALLREALDDPELAERLRERLVAGE